MLIVIINNGKSALFFCRCLLSIITEKKHPALLILNLIFRENTFPNYQSLLLCILFFLNLIFRKFIVARLLEVF